MKPRIAVINPGHTPDGGARANGLIEENVNDQIAHRLSHYLRRRGWGTAIIEQDGKSITLADIGRLARKCQPSVFVSIHINAGPKSATGVEAFVAAPDPRSRPIAQACVEAVTKEGLKSRGVKIDSQSQYKSLRVLRDTYKLCPAFLIEVGFLTNPADALLLKDKYWRERVACRMARALDEVIKQSS